MKIAVVGTGAMGSVYAALLADAGNEVWAIDQWPEHVAAMREKGLHLEGASGDRTVRLNATADPAEAGPCDLVIIATKAMHVQTAAEGAKALIGPETVVLTIQNGLGSADKVADTLGRDKVVIGVVGGFGASMKGPGHAHHNGWELVRLGEFEGPATPRLEAVAKVWADAGFRVKTFDDIHRMIWEKLICNVCFSGPCAMTEWTIAQVMAHPGAWMVAKGCAQEAYEVARAEGIALSFDDCEAYVRDFGSKIPNARPSMLLDHIEGRASEIDAINGAIPVRGRAIGVPTPFNDVITALVKAKEVRLGLRKE
ncbi:MAG: 2-dehydropantoate 2-reductase [Rhodospirillaceae bacterium]|nr:2-dehydropantoate 2-reductase [Rhodospirillaceae bacterium]